MVRETRKHPRYPFFGTAKISSSAIDEPGQVTTLTDNISEYGVGVRTYKPLAPGVEAQVELSFIGRNGKKETDIVRGTVVWIARKKNFRQGEFYLVGIAFMQGIHPRRNPSLYNHFSGITQGMN